jgi:hypothetical protein
MTEYGVVGKAQDNGKHSPSGRNPAPTWFRNPIQNNAFGSP